MDDAITRLTLGCDATCGEEIALEVSKATPAEWVTAAFYRLAQDLGWEIKAGRHLCRGCRHAPVTP